MSDGITTIKQGIKALRKGLETTVYAAAREVRGLKATCSSEYAEAVLDTNGHGGNTARVYFYRFAPEGFPRPSDRGAFAALLGDPQRSAEYNDTCYLRWKDNIQRVQDVIARYGGTVGVDGLPLQDYLREVEQSGKTPAHRVQITISVPGQEHVRLLREIEPAIERVEASQTRKS